MFVCVAKKMRKFDDQNVPNQTRNQRRVREREQDESFQNDGENMVSRKTHLIVAVKKHFFNKKK